MGMIREAPTRRDGAQGADLVSGSRGALHLWVRRLADLPGHQSFFQIVILLAFRGTRSLFMLPIGSIRCAFDRLPKKPPMALLRFSPALGSPTASLMVIAENEDPLGRLW